MGMTEHDNITPVTEENLNALVERQRSQFRAEGEVYHERAQGHGTNGIRVRLPVPGADRISFCSPTRRYGIQFSRIQTSITAPEK